MSEGVDQQWLAAQLREIADGPETGKYRVAAAKREHDRLDPPRSVGARLRAAFGANETITVDFINTERLAELRKLAKEKQDAE